jgi:hypothetical protein
MKKAHWPKTSTATTMPYHAEKRIRPPTVAAGPPCHAI